MRICSTNSILALSLILLSCGAKDGKEIYHEQAPLQEPVVREIEPWTADMVELSDEEYPDNPDIPIDHPAYNTIDFDVIEIDVLSEQHFNLTTITKDKADTINFEGLQLMEMIPFIQNRFRSDDYLSLVAVVNQEWNRQQVRFSPDFFKATKNNLPAITRIDIARNCLNSYLWELIAYAEHEGKDKVYYHAWFHFPEELYADLFFKRNGISINKYLESLKDWKDPENKKIDISKLREVIDTDFKPFINHNHEEFLKLGERNKKHPNIIYPKGTCKIQDFLTDSTQFATFSPPGYYNTKDPRKTKLSRLAEPDSIYFRTIQSPVNQQEVLAEFEIVFQSDDEAKKTHLIVSGWKPSELPVLNGNEVHKGWQSSMGFANHSFYESYQSMLERPSKDNPYFAYLTDGEGNWLDSHDIGIDGPLLYLDSEDAEKLHILILSFERHAVVGHYSLKI